MPRQGAALSAGALAVVSSAQACPVLSCMHDSRHSPARNLCTPHLLHACHVSEGVQADMQACWGSEVRFFAEHLCHLRLVHALTAALLPRGLHYQPDAAGLWHTPTGEVHSYLPGCSAKL